jgi:cytochrome c oxidase subunit 2
MLAVVTLVASAVGIVVGLAIDWFPAQGSTIADEIDTFWDVLLIVSVPIFMLVAVVIVYSIWRWHMRPGEEDLDGPPTHGNTTLEIVWTAIPTVIIAVLCAYATVLLLDIEETPAKGTRVVNVTGQQFAWTFETTEGGKKILSNQLVVPIGEPVKFNVRSKDVIHDFWVPEWRLKVDAVPGITTTYSLTPSKLGRFQVVCAELCGLGHAFMRQFVTIVTPQAYARWVADRAAPPAAAGDGDGAAAKVDGKQVFVAGNTQTGAASCGSCHVLADAGTNGQTGPNLDEVLAGQDAAAIRESIVSPGKQLTEGYGANIMPPNYGQTLTPAELDAVVAYLGENANGG